MACHLEFQESLSPFPCSLFILYTVKEEITVQEIAERSGTNVYEIASNRLKASKNIHLSCK